LYFLDEIGYRFVYTKPRNERYYCVYSQKNSKRKSLYPVDFWSGFAYNIGELRDSV
jgi:hypothetical protein